MKDYLELARDCGARINADNDARTTVATMLEDELSAFAERVRQEAAREQRERDAAICADIEARHWNTCKSRDHNNMQYTEGKSDGAGECQRGILAQPEPGAPK